MNRNLSKSLITIAISLSLMACDKDYDLSKDINGDMTIGNEFSVPVGKTDTIYATRVIKPSDNLDGSSGIFTVKVSGNTNAEINAVSVVSVDGLTPTFESVSVPLTIPSLVKSRSVSASSQFSTSARYSVDVLLPKEIESIDAASFMSDVFSTYMDIDIPSFPMGVDQVNLTNFSITLPALFQLSDGTNKVLLDPFSLSPLDKKKTIAIKIGALSIPETLKSKYLVRRSDGLHFVVSNDEIAINSNCSAIISDPKKLIGNSIKFNISYKSDKVAIIDRVKGDFSTSASFNQNILLQNIPEFIKGDKTRFTPSEAYMDLNLTNPTGETLYGVLGISSYKNDNRFAGPVNVALMAQPLINNKYVISNTERSVAAGYQNIVAPTLTDLLESVPDRIEVKTDNIKLYSKAANQSFKLGVPYTSAIDYDVNVPFKFKNVDIEYTDSIDGLLSDLKDVADKTNEIIVTATGVTTIPVDLSATVELLDINKNILKNIDVDLSNFKFAASKDGKESLSNISIKLTEKEGSKELEQLDTIRYTIHSVSDRDLTLATNQFLVIKNIKAKITKGINVSL